VRLAFIGESTDEPFIVSLFTRFNVIANILQAHMEMVHNASLGIAICQMLGEAERIAQSIDFLRQQGIQVEVLGYVPNRITAQ
jgi:D-methionine transport system ATP-binding protein